MPCTKEARPRTQLASKAAHKSASPNLLPLLEKTNPPITSPSSTSTDLASSPQQKHIPKPIRITKTESSRVIEPIKLAIANVPEEYLRCAILEICTKLPEATRLLGGLISASPLEKKRKRGVEMCHVCGETVNDITDGRCKRWVMREYKREEPTNAVEASSSDGSVADSRVEICEFCDGEADDSDSGCCKSRRMWNSRRQTLIQELDSMSG